jgi:hypothetical protein
MRLKPTYTASEIETVLRNQAERIYGQERAQELSARIAHLAKAMSVIARRELDLGPVPDSRGPLNRRCW